MSNQSASSHLKVLFEAALQDYEWQTGIVLAEHPLAERLQECDSVESITAVLHEQTQAFSEFRGKEKIMKSLKNVVSILCKISAWAKFEEVIGMVSPARAVYTELAVLLSVIKGVKSGYVALVEFLESIEQFLYRLDIYTEITPTVAMTEILVKILVELLSTLALATKQIRQGRMKKIFKKLLWEKDVEATFQRLDRLIQDETKSTKAQTLKVVFDLFQNMRVIMDDGKASFDNVRNTLEIMHQVTSEINQLKRDMLHEDVQRWLSPPDPWEYHNVARGSQHGGTAEWFVKGNTFSAWKASGPSSLLWIHGKPGAGKSVLCSSIIEDISAMQRAGLASLAFFYFDFREDQKNDLRGLLSSLLVQLSHQSDSYSDILSKFYSEHAEGSQHPSDDEIARCLTDLLKLPGHAPVYLVVDALDECPNPNTSAVRSPRADVLNLIEELIKSQFPNLCICVTSRPEIDIMDVLDTLTFCSVSLHNEDGQKRDIEEYIKSVIYTHPKNGRWKVEHKRLVIDVLTEMADGMFLWADCQLAYIYDCIPACVQHALAELPVTLDATYERTLREINKADWKFAHRLFQFVAVASRPLRVEELAELLAFDFEAEPVPRFQEGWRLEDPVYAVMSICPRLLAIVDGGHRVGEVVQFSHFSVKEFLTSDRLAETSDVTLHRYHVSMTAAHTLAAQACLGILLHLEKDVVPRNSLKDFPLAEYAAEHWADHARFEDVSRNMDRMNQLFDPSKPHLSVSLHHAAAWGLHSIVEFLVVGHLQDVQSRSPIDNATPLHLASGYGHIKVARFLLERGAYVTAKNKDGETPLHLASQNGQVEVALVLIEFGANLTAQNEVWEVPLHVASREGQVKVAHMLIEHGADLTAQNKDWDTPLHVALRNGQVQLARMLLEHGADPTAQNEDGDSPLHAASRSGQVEVAHMLLEHGADPTAQNEDGETPLHLALLRGHAEVARVLIERGADVTAQKKNGWTPLHLVEEVEITRMLLERGADAIAQNEDGDTPLHAASRDGQVEVAHMLIKYGSDPKAQNKDGETPLHVALRDEQVQIILMLLEYGADPSAQNKDGEIPLHLALALREGHVEVARSLLEHGADVTAQNKDGWTPLHLASQEGHVEVACMLIEHGAGVSAQEEDGWTPLHLASFNSQVEIVCLLIEHGADPTVKNNDKETPLDLVSTHDRDEESSQRFVEVEHILLEHSADVKRTNMDRLHWIGTRGLQKFHAFLSNMMSILARA